jgi:hypothetical protein
MNDGVAYVYPQVTRQYKDTISNSPQSQILTTITTTISPQPQIKRQSHTQNVTD